MQDIIILILEMHFGGRTEGFKSYHKCNEHQKVFYYDVVSLYPTVNSLDEYAVGFSKYVNLTLENINNNENVWNDFMGIVKNAKLNFHFWRLRVRIPP